MSKPVVCPLCGAKMKLIYINKYGNILYAVRADRNSKCSHGTNFMYESAEAAVKAWNTMAVGLSAGLSVIRNTV